MCEEGFLSCPCGPGPERAHEWLPPTGVSGVCRKSETWKAGERAALGLRDRKDSPEERGRERGKWVCVAHGVLVNGWINCQSGRLSGAWSDWNSGQGTHRDGVRGMWSEVLRV